MGSHGITDQNIVAANAIVSFGSAVAVSVIALWTGAIVLITQAGWFIDPSTSLPIRLMPAVAVPPAVFLIAYRFLPQLRRWVDGLDLAMVVGVQTFRVIGIVFVFDWAQGELPAVFAAPAGLGDIAVGAFALFVTVRVARAPEAHDNAVRSLAIAGFVDFAAAFTFATLASRGMPLSVVESALPLAAQTFPASLIPTLAVPMFMIAHIISLLKMSHGRPLP
jgi:hypothetical protein